MRTTWGVVKILGSLLPFFRNILEGTTCQGLVSLVDSDLFLRRQTAAAAEEVLLPLLDPDFLDLAMVLSTGIQQTGNIFAHATDGGSHCGHLTSSNRDSSNGGNRTAPCFSLLLFFGLVDKKHTPFLRIHFFIQRGRVPRLVNMQLLLIQMVMVTL